MESNVEQLAEKVKAYAEKHTEIYEEGGKRYAPIEVWQYGARLLGLAIRISEVKKGDGVYMATADLVGKPGEPSVSSQGCAMVDEGANFTPTHRMKLAQSRAASSVLCNNIAYLLKAAGFAEVTMEDHLEAPPPIPKPKAAEPEPPAGPPKKPLDYFKGQIDQFDGKLALMVEKLNILSDARKEGYSAEEMEELETYVKQRYEKLKK